MTEKIYINWQDFHQHTKSLAQKLKKAGSFSKIIAISRGGLVPAGILAYELNIRDCNTINISSYDGEKQRDISDISFAVSSDIVDSSQVLIIDDLADSGRTFNLLRPYFPSATFACVYAKPKGIASVDLCAQELPDKWVIFPWD